MFQLIIPYKTRVVSTAFIPTLDWQVVKPLFTVSNNERYCLQNLRATVEGHFKGDTLDTRQLMKLLNDRLILLSFLQDLIAINDKSIDVLNALLWHQRTTKSLVLLINATSRISMNQFLQMLSLVGVGSNTIKNDRREKVNVSQTKDFMYQPHTHVPIITRCKFI